MITPLRAAARLLTPRRGAADRANIAKLPELCAIFNRVGQGQQKRR